MVTRLYIPYVLGSGTRSIIYQYQNLLRELSPADFHVTYFRKSDTNPLPDRPNANRVPISHDNRPLKLARMFRSSFHSHDVLHTGGSPRLRFLLSRCASIRNRNIGHVHTFHIDVDPTAGAEFEYKRKIASSADRLLAVSKHTAQTAEEAFDVDVGVVYNGIDVEFYRPDRQHPDSVDAVSAGKPCFLFVGQFHERKRPEDVLSVAENVPDATFLLRGSGGNKVEVVHERANQLENVRLLDRLSKTELARLYAAVDGLLFPSVREGCPTVVLEAMAAATPVVGYEATSMPELVTHDETGFLSGIGDIDGLIEDVRKLTEDERSDRMGEAARRYAVENHSFAEVASQYEQHYDEVAP